LAFAFVAKPVFWGRRFSCPLNPRVVERFMRPLVLTVTLLGLSNVFMTLAWYGHLKNGLDKKAWYIAAVVSWGIALFEYLLQVPANRIGFSMFSLSQLKILQEAISLSVFAVLAVVWFKEEMRLDFLWAALCICGAAYFVFRK
jgi:uncharacterized protein (DUF486 family)